MKKLILVLALIFSFSLSYAEEETQKNDAIQQQVEKYKEECYNKSYPVDDEKNGLHIITI